MLYAVFSLLFGLLVGGQTAYLIREWIRDLKFYHSFGWDFSKDSGHRIYPSSSKTRGKRMVPVPNKQRVLVGYPSAILVGSVCAILILYREFWGALNG